MKKILFTGASGFLGQNTKDELCQKYLIKTLGYTEFDDYKINLAKKVPTFNETFDYVIHAAGKAHIEPKTEKEIEEFFQINFIGTKNLCAGLEQTGLPRAFIFISTVAVYGLDSGENITEANPLNGSTPYAQSKIKAENHLIKWSKESKVNLTILRPSLIAGKNPTGNLGALIAAMKGNRYFRIGDGQTRKSVLMAQDIARLVPKVIVKGGIFNICDNKHPSFFELEELIAKQLIIKSPRSIPYWMVKFIAKIGDLLGSKAPLNSNKLHKMITPLTFSNQKARKELNWEPLDVLHNFRIE